jgi:succinylglutamate desuccinylase
MVLRELDALPDGLLELAADQLQDALGGPTLIHLAGQRQPSLFVSILLHGNETTGWEAVRRWLSGFTPGGGSKPLPRGLSLFVGNTLAAAQGLRRLDDQPDYNRVWPGGEDRDSHEARLMHQVVDAMARRGVFASVDIHNNTGLNPHYACINRIENDFLHLAALFGRTVIYFVTPRGVQSMAMAELCPAVTLECGKVGQAHGIEHAIRYLDACLHLVDFPSHPVSSHDVDLYHTVAVARVRPEVGIGFDNPQAELNLVGDLDGLNFRELPAGTLFGEVGDAGVAPITVHDERTTDVTARYFDWSGGRLRTRLPLMPSMLTRDERVIRQDCLCYVMERYDAHLRNRDGTR